MKNFQVNTFALSQVKQLLCDLYSDNVGNHNFVCINDYFEYKYLQFWFDNYRRVTHSIDKHKDSEISDLSINEAVEYLSSYNKVKLTDNLSLDLQNSQFVVCPGNDVSIQIPVPVEKLKELATKINQYYA